MEQRLTRLETSIEQLQSDVTEIKLGIQQLDARVDGIKDSVDVLRLHVT